MTKLLEIKDRVIKFYGKFETYIHPAVKFLLAMLSFLMINRQIGYLDRLQSLPMVLILALLCGILPMNFTLWIAMLMILLHLYSLSLEVAITALVLFAVVFFLYFRFAPKDGVMVLITPICFLLRIPYIMPIASGLLRQVYSVISVVCGTVIYFFLDGVSQNATILMSAGEEGAIVTKSKFDVSVGQLLRNKEMFLVIAVFVLASLVVYMVRRLEVEQAWTLAIVSGILVELTGLFVGYLILSISDKTLWLLLGNVFSLLLGFALKFWFMNLDYARTERVQFEDDEYYYYVKAIPKKMVAGKEVTVKHFGNTVSMGKRVNPPKQTPPAGEKTQDNSRRVIAKELDIDEDLLK